MFSVGHPKASHTHLLQGRAFRVWILPLTCALGVAVACDAGSPGAEDAASQPLPPDASGPPGRDGALPARDASLPSRDASASSGDVPPIYFFYAIHTHINGDHSPYTNERLTSIDENVRTNMLDAITRIGEVLDSHGAKGTWEVVYGTASGICNADGMSRDGMNSSTNVFRDLQAGGHSIAMHLHKNRSTAQNFNALQEDCGITPRTTSGQEVQVDRRNPETAQETASDWLQEQVSFGMRYQSSNMATSTFTDTGACTSVGVGNDMASETGNYMFPWRADYLGLNVCNDNPMSQMITVDHISIEAWTGGAPPNLLTDEHFGNIQVYFDGARAYMERERPERTAAWGFISHITEYMPRASGGEPINEGSLDALDRFLTYVDTYVASGHVVYATVDQIAELAFPGD